MADDKRQVHVRLPDEVYKFYQDEAAKLGHKTNAHIRATLIRAAIEPKNKLELR